MYQLKQNTLLLDADGAFVRRQQVASHELLAYTVVTEVTISVRKSLSQDVMEHIVDTFTGEVMNGSLPLTVQLRCMDLLVKCQEEVTAQVRKAASSQELDQRTRRLLGRILMCMLTKLEQMALLVRHLLCCAHGTGENIMPTLNAICETTLIL